MPIYDPESDYAYVQNATLVSTRIPGENVEKDGFSSARTFFEWITTSPICIELNRPCRSGEEIIVDYSWMDHNTRTIPPATPNSPSTPQTPKSPASTAQRHVAHGARRSPRLLAAEKTPTATDMSPVTENKNSSTVPETLHGNEEQTESVCAECGRKADRGHKCDVCNKLMHGCCGIGIGEEGYGQIRRCKIHPKGPQAAADNKKRKTSKVSLFHQQPEKKQNCNRPFNADR